jgi:very-short-patch-repair endonuclease
MKVKKKVKKLKPFELEALKKKRIEEGLAENAKRKEKLRRLDIKNTRKEIQSRKRCKVFEDDCSKKELAIKFAKKLRESPTNAEVRIRKILINDLCLKVIFQKPFIRGNFYIVDFLLPDYGVCIEVDGEYHNNTQQIKKDIKRDLYLKERGYKVIRITNKRAESITSEELFKKINA